MKTKRLVAGIMAYVMLISFTCSDSNVYAAGSSDGARTVSTADADIWSAPASVKVLSDKPASDYADVRTDGISLTAAKNEYESGQIIVSAKKDLSFTVSLSDLVDVNDENNVISKDNFTVYTQKYIEVTEQRYGSGEPTGYYPDAILPQENAAAYGLNQVKQGANGGAWLEFYIPEDTASGSYKGEAVVTIGNVTTILPVSLKVYDVTIPSESHQKSLFNVNIQQVADHEKDDSWEMVEKYFDLLMKYRCSPTDITNGCSLSAEEYAEKAYAYCQKGMSTVGVPSSTGRLELDGFLVFDYEKTSDYIVALAKKSLKTNYNLIEKAAFYNFYIDEPFYAKYDDGQVATSVKAFDLAIERAVWKLERDPEFTGSFCEQLLADIPNIPNIVTDYNTDEYRNSERTCNELKNADGTSFTYAGTSVSLCPKPDAYKSEGERASYQTDGERWWYNCNDPKSPYPTYHMDDPIGAVAFEWMMAEYDIVGNLYWVTNLHTNFATGENLENPYDLAQRGSGANGDGVLIYPGEPYGVDGPVASIRLDAIRDGYEDYELIYMIKEKCADLETDCADIIKRIRASLYQESKVVGGPAEYEAAREELLQLAEMLCSQEKNFSCYVEEGQWSSSEGRVYQEKISRIYNYDVDADTYTKTSDGADEENVSLLFADRKYQDFELEFDVKLNTENAADTLLWFVFGKQDLYKKAYTCVEEKDGTTVIRFTNGGVNDQGYHACQWETDWQIWRWGASYRGNIDLSKKLHARLLVEEGTYSLWIDDHLIIDHFELPENYRTGYVGIGYGRADISVSNLRIGEVKAENPADGYPEVEGKVFAGWYQDAAFTEPVYNSADLKTGNAYAKYADAKVLTVKYQLTAGTSANSARTNLRLLTTVDSLKYQSVGFDIEVNGRIQSVKSTSVYPQIYCLTKDGEEMYTASDAFGCEESAYFMAFKLTGIPNSAFSTPIRVTPKWTTLDGTVVTGTTRTIVINDVLEKQVWNGFDSADCADVWSWGSAELDWLSSYEGANGVMKVDLKYPDEGNVKYVGEIGSVNWPSAGRKAGDYSGAVGLVFRVKIEGSASNALTILDENGAEMGIVFDGQGATDGWQEFVWKVDVEKEYDSLNKMSWIFWVNGNSTIYLDEIRVIYQREEWNGFDSADCAKPWSWDSAELTWMENYAGANGVMKVDLKFPDEGNTKYVGTAGSVNWPAVGTTADDYHGATGLVFRVKIEGSASNALAILDENGLEMGRVFDGQGATDGWQEFVWKVDVEKEYENLNKMSWIFWVNDNSTIYLDGIRVSYEKDSEPEENYTLWNGFDNDDCIKPWGWDSAQRTWLESYDGAEGVMKVDLSGEAYVGADGTAVNWPAAGSKASDYHGAKGLIFRVKIEGEATNNHLEIFGYDGTNEVGYGTVFDGQGATDGWQEFVLNVDVEKEYESLTRMWWRFWVGTNSTIYIDEIRAFYPQENWNSFDSADCAGVWSYQGAELTWLENYEGANGVMKVDLKYPYPNEENTKFVGATEGEVNWLAAGSKALDYHGATGLAFRVKIEGNASNALTVYGHNGEWVNYGPIFNGQGATDGWQEFVLKVDVEAEYENLTKMFWAFWVNDNSTIYLDGIRVIYED